MLFETVLAAPAVLAEVRSTAVVSEWAEIADSK